MKTIQMFTKKEKELLLSAIKKDLNETDKIANELCYGSTWVSDRLRLMVKEGILIRSGTRPLKYQINGGI